MGPVNSESHPKWFNFSANAKALVLQGQQIDHSAPNISICIEPSFDDIVTLQLIITNDIVEWHRTTWLRSLDSPKFTPIEELKYIGKTITPTIKHENGTTDKNHVEQIIALARNLSLAPVLDPSGRIVLDGTYYTLTIGTGNSNITYTWHYLPDSWLQLQTLSNMLEELNKRLQMQ